MGALRAHWLGRWHAWRTLAALLSALALIEPHSPARAQSAPESPPRHATASEPSVSESDKRISRVLESARRRMSDAPASLWEDLRARRYVAAMVQLLALEANWAMDADYNTLLAETALATRRYAEATLALERLVLLQPGNAGAWLDLAIASEALGDVETARRALDTLSRAFPSPPGINLVTTMLRARLLAAQAAPATSRLSADLMFGHDSNANGGLAVNSLTLTPAGSTIELPIDPSFQPRASSFWLARLEGVGRWQSQWGPIDVRFGLAERRYASEPEFNTRDIAFALAGRVPAAERTYWAAELRSVDIGGRHLLDIPRVRAMRELRREAFGCTPTLGIELEARGYRASLDAYDGTLLWLAGGARCAIWGGTMLGLLRIGNDWGPADRPGGNTARQEVAVLWHGTVADRVDVLTGLNLSASSDAAGYNPLIANGIARRANRLAWRGELTWRMGGGWHTVFSAEHTNQRSNLGLFSFRQTVLLLGLHYVH